ncbi:MAG: C-GCAxxG-C-C family protein [Gemmatimonadota bacterium]|nr:C-GCAxxG-C-C family protein [Gemmatimonadota bacterium]
MRKVLTVSFLALVHFVLTIVAVATSFGSGMSRFDTGAAPGAGERVLDAAAALLTFPLVQAMIRWFPLPAQYRQAPWEHLVFVANSFLWGAAIYALARKHRYGARFLTGSTPSVTDSISTP